MLSHIFKSDILFTGYYGHYNTGDDAFVEVASWGAKKYWNKNNNRFLTKKNLLPKVKSSIQGFPFNIPKTYKLQRKLLVSQADYLISAGGSTIHGIPGVDSAKSLSLKKKEQNPNYKIGAIGVSIGPFKTLEDEHYTQKYLQNINFLAVRDQASYDYVSQLKLPYQPVNAFDLAALLPDIYEIPKKPISNHQKVIGISVCPVESISDPKNIKTESIRNLMTAELIRFLDSQDDILFKFFIINGHPKLGDLETTLEVINRSQPKNFEIVKYQRQTQLMWNNIALCDFLISTRLHGAIFACFSETPFILNEYHKKCTDFLDSIGFGDELRVYNNKYDPMDIGKKIIKIINQPNNFLKPYNIKKMQEQAYLNFTGVII